ncbi:hypothetical protein [Aliagarivorans marinus]|uniref:hypothetical protein n=1 Tax=Aliagarivorans marinus TaxID=561965 RepID=UPI0012FCB2CB|nr:hypothetical protein [Aliagarivorans marinus]
MMFIVRLVCCSLLLSLTACSQNATQPIASRSIVENVVREEVDFIPEEFWELLLNGSVGDEFTLSGYELTIGEIYYSASGRWCRKVGISTEPVTSDSKHYRRVTCKVENGPAWYLSSTTLANR